MTAAKIKRTLLIPLLVFALILPSVSVRADETAVNTEQQTEYAQSDQSSSEDNTVSDMMDPEAEDPEESVLPEQEDLTENESAEQVPDVSESKEDPEQELSDENTEEPEQETTNIPETSVTPEPGTEDLSEPEKTEDKDGDSAKTDGQPQSGEDTVIVPEETQEEEKAQAEATPTPTPTPTPKPAVKPTVEKFYFGEMDGSGNAFFYVKGVSSASGIKKMKVAIWVNTDKSDRKLYQIKNGKTSFSVSEHGYLFGQYKARLYIWDNDGNTWNMGLVTKKYTAAKPSAESVSMAFSGANVPTFKMKVTNVQSQKGIREVRAFVWSEADKSNKKWYYNFTPDGSGNYTKTGSFANHKYKEGKYHVAVYVVDNTGVKKLVRSTTKQVNAVCTDMKAAYNKTSCVATFTLLDLKSRGLIDHVEYAVWREGNDQKDLKWYSAKLGDGTCSAAVNMASQYGVKGTYNVHCYAVMKNGSRKYMAGKQFKISSFPTAATCTVSRITKGKVKLTIKSANVEGVPAESVKVAVWSEATGVGNSSAQDDIVWYKTTKNDNGTFTCTVNRTKHLSSGNYIAHVYAYAGSKEACCTGKEFTLTKTAAFDGKYAEVARCCILAVETGGQIYGNARYNDFTEAYHISAAETGITIGAGQWMGANAVRLLLDIRSADPAMFKKLDSYGISIDLDNLLNMPESSWNYYGGSDTVGGVFKSGDMKATAIQALISSSVGIAVQNTTVENNLAVYVARAAELGVEDIDAQIFMANVCHLGGSGAMSRIVTKTKNAGLALTMENLWAVMQQDVSDTSSSNQVGDTIYRSRHVKIIGWIYQYLN